MPTRATFARLKGRRGPADDPMVGDTILAESISGAGASAFEQSDLLAGYADSLERQILSLQDVLRELRKREGAWRAGARGERSAAERIHQVLVDFGSADWHMLVDRRWPGTRSANIDLLLVGPPGVCVIDSKKWRDPRIEDGSLWNGDDREDDRVDAVRDQAEAVLAALAPIGLAPPAIHPIVVLGGRATAPISVRGVSVVGDQAIQRALVRLGARLSPHEIDQVVEALDRACPPAGGTRTTSARTAQPRRVGASTPKQESAQTTQTQLLDASDILAAVREVAMREPIESWMTWLHPHQAQLVARGYNGPARVRGAAGTGKTVVALHRAARLAQDPGSHVLVTSYVRTLPAVHRSLFERLAPASVSRVRFQHLHGWAMGLLRRRGVAIPPTIDGSRQFADAWANSPSANELCAVVDSADYWREEIDSVIKGRGLTDRGDYITLNRIGRRTPVRESVRIAAWDLFKDYEARLKADNTWDWNDVISQALTSLTATPLERPYTAVIVDEVQDLTCQGLRLLHALVRDAPDGLFLVGDGQQSVSPGGFSLAEAGIHIPGGRSTVLRRNYRNREQVLLRALEIVKSDVFDDLDQLPESGAREIECEQDGGWVAQVRADDESSLVTALTVAYQWAVAHGHRPGDMATLLPSNAAAASWAAKLAAHGIPTQMLTDYDGRPTDAVKVGTYQRAKGLEFSCVYLPRHDQAVLPQRPDESDDAFAERAELERRRLFVAMTRARDRLWLGTMT